MNTKEKAKEIQKLKKLLDWYIDCTSDDEFDSDVVISLLHQLDALEPIAPEPIESVEVFIANSWEYCKRRENEERILRSFAECPTNLQTKYYHRKSYLLSFFIYFVKNRR